MQRYGGFNFAVHFVDLDALDDSPSTSNDVVETVFGISGRCLHSIVYVIANEVNGLVEHVSRKLDRYEGCVEITGETEIVDVRAERRFVEKILEDMTWNVRSALFSPERQISGTIESTT